MRSIVMLRLGGARVVEFAHCFLSLLSITTIQRNIVLQPITVSPSLPTIAEIEANITLCQAGLAGIDNNPSNNLDSHTRSGGLVIHQVLMFDELAIEQHTHWDDSTNMFLGICCEHGYKIPLEFTSERELDILCNAIGDNTVHLTSEATVMGIGTLSQIPCEYSVCPIMFLGTCKRETGPHHVRVIQAVLDTANNVNQGSNVQKNVSYHTVCVASDGEAKRGDALVILTMSSQLSAGLPIYGQLLSLKLMNYLVGPDDLIADKDYKHIFKRQRNLLMWHKGVLIQGFCVTLAILRIHLESNGVPSH
jgi:hypothetical protein